MTFIATAALSTRADRHRLYELSVQNAELEVDFIDATFHRLRGRRAAMLREDFCGTAKVCCDWVRRRKGNQAIGVDLDPEVLAWGQAHNLAALEPSQRERVELLEADVRCVVTRSPDLILAMNFSYWLLKERDQLKGYFARARDALLEGGVLFLDAYGGYDAFRVIEERRSLSGDFGPFTYIWEQERYDPISGRLICHIHFEFPDGSRLERAFSYDWRLWTLPEIQDLLHEVGFERVSVYWQGWDERDEPNGRFEPTVEGEPDASWICYLTAEK
jgi:hypothetical protein